MLRAVESVGWGQADARTYQASVLTLSWLWIKEKPRKDASRPGGGIWHMLAKGHG